MTDPTPDRLVAPFLMPLDIPQEAVDMLDASGQRLKVDGNPLALVPDGLCAVLTRDYLHPKLRAAGIANWEQYQLTYDTDPIPFTRPIPADGTV